jgi:hypothetical protein
LHFVCADIQLCDAAKGEGLHVLNPTDAESLAFIKMLQQ